MRKIIIMTNFMSVIIVSLIMNFTRSKNTISDDTSLLAINMVAIANAEGCMMACVQPHRWACYIDPYTYQVTLGVLMCV